MPAFLGAAVANDVSCRRYRMVKLMRWKRVVYTVMLVLCVDTSGCSRWNAPIEYREMSYADYKERIATPSFDPVGATSISARLDFERDGFDEWWKMRIPKTDWINLLKQIGMRNPRMLSRHEETANWIRESWPKPENEPPQWWIPGNRFGSLTAVSQEQQSPGQRASGWYWLYDEQSNTAIAWNWNRQYWTFPSSDSLK